MAASAPAPLHLYRRILRLARRLPADARPYYAQYARENFAAFRDESDAERAADMTRRGAEHTKWVAQKFKMDEQVVAKVMEGL
ncbi:unnamed protein product [Closterium sp. NIES-64]|nr:unnamed protein product [Closterium sp. Naga37s-1]CAI5942665.1 unnamed protein product [Closterium sp. NIES-64]CAI5981174.1 unnamed protein product [Closterium sp. NIES-65]